MLTLLKFILHFLIVSPGYVTPYLILQKTNTIKTSKKTFYSWALGTSIPAAVADTIFALNISTKLHDNTFAIGLSIGIILTLYYFLFLVFLKIATNQNWYRYFSFFFLAQIPVFASTSLHIYFCFDKKNFMTSYPRFSMSLILQYLPGFLFTTIIFVINTYLCSKLFYRIYNKKNYLLPRGVFYVLNTILLYLTLSSKLPEGQRLEKVLLISSSLFSSIIYFIFYVGFCLLLFLFMYLFYKRRYLTMENSFLKEQVNSQYDNYLALQRNEEEVHKLYHDIGNHIITLELLIRDHNTEQAAAYLKDVSEQYKTLKQTAYSNNNILNIVLSQKMNLCDRYQIKHTVDIQVPVKTLISDVDLVSVFSNLLDNALEACLADSSSEKLIQVRTSCVGDYIAIKVTNSKSESANHSARSLLTWKKRLLRMGMDEKS